MKTDIYDIAEIENLQVIETTSEYNGYPSNIKKALIGFDDFASAERVAGKYGMNIEFFTKRDGWQLYYRTGSRAYSPIEVSAEDYGNDYESFTSKDLEEYYENNVQGMIGEFTDFEQVESFLAKEKKIYEAIEELEDDEMVLTCQGHYYDTIKQFTMSFYYDTKITVIGLIKDFTGEESVDKDDVLDMLRDTMFGCSTAVCSKDVNGVNAFYGALPVNSFFDEENFNYLPSDGWILTDFQEATPELADVDIWAQEFPSDQIADFRDLQEKENLYIASFKNDEHGTLDILIWK